MPKTDTSPLTTKQRRFARSYAKTGNGTRAALDAGYAPSVAIAAVAASENLEKPKIREAIIAYLSKGMPVSDRIANVLDGAMGANVEDKEDHGTRLKAADLAAKVVGLYQEADVETRRHAHVHLHLDPRLSRFVVLHGRYPSAQERQALGLPPATEPMAGPDTDLP